MLGMRIIRSTRAARLAAALAPLRGGPMLPWVRPTLWAGYALFVILVVLLLRVL